MLNSLWMRLDTNLEVKNIARVLKIIKDDKLGMYLLGLRLILSDQQCFDSAEQVFRWLSPPDSSRNYNEAREKHQAKTGLWFTNGTQFARWMEVADVILWIYGTRKYSDRLCTAR